MHKVLISVAPVSAADTHPDSASIAADVIQSAHEGAGQVHLHVRDLHGALTPDLTVFKQTVEPIAAASDIVIQAPTARSDSRSVFSVRGTLTSPPNLCRLQAGFSWAVLRVLPGVPADRKREAQ